MKIIGKNKDVLAFLRDLPVRKGEKVVDFMRTFTDCSMLRNLAFVLYNVKIEFN